MVISLKNDKLPNLLSGNQKNEACQNDVFKKFLTDISASEGIILDTSQINCDLTASGGSSSNEATVKDDTGAVKTVTFKCHIK